MSDPRYDPDHPANRPMLYDDTGMGTWIVGVLVVFAVIAGIFWMTSGTNTNVAQQPTTESTGSAPPTPRTAPAPAERTTPAPAPQPAPSK